MRFGLFINEFVLLIYGLPLILAEESYPNPADTNGTCNNHDLPHICDPSQELSDDEKINLNKLITSLATNYSCTPCSDCSNSKQLQVGIATVNDISKTISEESDLVISLRTEWKLSNCENDIIVLASKASKQIYLSVGGPASVHLPSTCAKIIAEYATKKLTTSVYDSLVLALEEIMRVYFNPQNGSALLDTTCFKTAIDRNFVLKPEIIFLIVLSAVILLGLIIFGIYHLRGVRRNKALNYRPEFNSFYNPSVTIDRSKFGTSEANPQTNEMRVKSQEDEEGYQEVDLGQTNIGYNM